MGKLIESEKLNSKYPKDIQSVLKRFNKQFTYEGGPYGSRGPPQVPHLIQA